MEESSTIVPALCYSHGGGDGSSHTDNRGYSRMPAAHLEASSAAILLTHYFSLGLNLVPCADFGPVYFQFISQWDPLKSKSDHVTVPMYSEKETKSFQCQGGSSWLPPLFLSLLLAHASSKDLGTIENIL